MAGGLFSIRHSGAHAPAATVGVADGATVRANVDPLTQLTNSFEQVTHLQALVRARPRDAEANARLGIAYLQRARDTNDPSWYPKAATLLATADRLQPANLDATLGLGSLALSRHDFRRALVLGQKAIGLSRDSSASGYAIVGDAEIELGRYSSAFRTMDELGRLHPSLVAYARQSYAAELQGDLPSATDFMRRAVDAGAGAGEAAAWTRVQYAALLLKQGRISAAEGQYRHALAVLPTYARARAGLGAVAVARGALATAEGDLQGAADEVPLPEILIALGDVQTARGEHAAASATYALVRAEQRLFQAAGGNVDLELALFDANHPGTGGPDAAGTIALARKAVAERPSVYAHDALAWALYKAGDCRAALPEAGAATAIGTADPELRWHLGAIAACAGERRVAITALHAALRSNPRFHPLDAPAARALLERLEAR